MTNKEFGQKCRTWAKKNTVQWLVKKFILKNKYCKPNSIGVKGRAYLKDVKQQTYQAFIAKFY